MWRNVYAMSEKPKKLHYVQEWIEFRKLSLRRLAERMEKEPGEELLSSSSIGRIANGEQPLEAEVLHAMADAFDCAPEDIIGINPLLKPELIDFMAAARRLRDRDRDKILEVTRVLEAMAISA